MNLRKRNLSDKPRIVDVEETPLPDPLPLAPAAGWHPDDFPQLTVVFVPYTTEPKMRADPTISVLADGWLYLQLGNIRVAIPDREEWNKLVHMVEATFNTHERDRAVQQALEADVPVDLAAASFEELDGLER